MAHPHDIKGLIPKDAKSIFDQNRVTNIIALFSLYPTFKTHSDPNITNKIEDNCKFNIKFSIDAYTYNSRKETRFAPKSRKWI